MVPVYPEFSLTDYKVQNLKFMIIVPNLKNDPTSKGKIIIVTVILNATSK